VLSQQIIESGHESIARGVGGPQCFRKFILSPSFDAIDCEFGDENGCDASGHQKKTNFRDWKWERILKNLDFSGNELSIPIAPFSSGQIYNDSRGYRLTKSSAYFFVNLD